MQIDPSTIGIVGGVLVALTALVIYVENIIIEPEAPIEDWETHMNDELNARDKEGGKRTKITKNKKRTKRNKLK